MMRRVMWMVQDREADEWSNGHWIAYRTQWSDVLETAFQYRLQHPATEGTVELFDSDGYTVYEVDLVRLVQTRVSTGAERPVRRFLW